MKKIKVLELKKLLYKKGNQDENKVAKYKSHFNREGLPFSRLLSGSKTLYRNAHPKHKVTFNARIYLKSNYEEHKAGKIKDFFAGQEEEIWYGDIDLNLDRKALKKVAKSIGENLVITGEGGWFVEEIKAK